jgi:hypothetical protein
MKIISIEKTAIDNFMKKWPCSGLHNIDHILTAFDNEGNLIDMDAFNDVSETEQTDYSDYDGTGAMLALLAEAYEHATRNSQPANMINTGYMYK